MLTFMYVYDCIRRRNSAIKRVNSAITRMRNFNILSTPIGKKLAIGGKAALLS